MSSTLSAIKDKLDASLQRRGELRDTMGDLSKAAVEAHIAKLEKAEARHQEELQALRVVAEKARSEATQAREEAKKARDERAALRDPSSKVNPAVSGDSLEDATTAAGDSANSLQQPLPALHPQWCC